MRILAFSDLHRKIALTSELKRKAKDVDLVICCGDLSDFGRGLDIVCSNLSSIHDIVLIIPGNNETPAQIEAMCRKYGWINLHGETYSYGGYTFAGIGGSTYTPFRTPFELDEEEIRGILRHFEGLNELILVSHSPPFKTKTDELLSGVHIGSRAIREFVEKEQPILNLCGHIHEKAGVEDRIGRTRIINVGGRGTIVELP